MIAFLYLTRHYGISSCIYDLLYAPEEYVREYYRCFYFLNHSHCIIRYHSNKMSVSRASILYLIIYHVLRYSIKLLLAMTQRMRYKRIALCFCTFSEHWMKDQLTDQWL